jgi:hypothetical protein
MHVVGATHASLGPHFAWRPGAPEPALGSDDASGVTLGGFAWTPVCGGFGGELE